MASPETFANTDATDLRGYVEDFLYTRALASLYSIPEDLKIFINFIQSTETFAEGQTYTIKAGTTNLTGRVIQVLTFGSLGTGALFEIDLRTLLGWLKQNS